ncbi:MAG: hypothetical protein PHO23_03355 [Candidatus Pacebacteria bacterium]|nr:hypothetical protein [Candidatus Paceibacterota bacterium]
MARCFGFTEKEAELCYLVSNDYFMITTSQASITKAHVALFGESTSAVNNTVEGVMEEVPVVEAPAE